MSAVRVPWSSASFLVYVGGLTILAATFALLSSTANQHGAAGFVWWSLLIFVVLSVAAFGARQTGHLVTAGVLALSSVASFIIVLGAVLDWFGWLPDFDHPFRGFRFWLLVLELATVVAAATALRRFRFPPFVFEAALRAEATKLDTAMRFLRTAAALANAPEGVHVYDPVPNILTRRAGLERAQLVIQSRSRPALQAYLSAISTRLFEHAPREVRWHLDVDPIEFD